MCLIELVVSIKPCRHRWYHLLESCTPNTSLDDCPGVFQIHGMAKNVPYCQFCDYGMNRNPQEYKFLGSDADPPSTITRWESPPMFPRGSGCVVRGWSRGAAEMPPQVSETELRLREAEKNMAANRRLSVYLDGHQHEPAENVTESIGPHITIVEKGPKPPGKGGEGDEGPSSRPGRLWAKVKEGVKEGLGKVSK